MNAPHATAQTAAMTAPEASLADASARPTAIASAVPARPQRRNAGRGRPPRLSEGPITLHPVGLRELGVLLGEHLGEVDHHAALLPGRVVLHLAVDHVH